LESRKNDVKNYVRWLKSEDSSNRKIEHRVRGIRGTYRILVEENTVDNNPADNYFPSDFLDSTVRGNAQNERTIAENKRGPRTNFDTIEPEEFEKLLENVKAPRFRNQFICKMMWQLMLRSEQITYTSARFDTVWITTTSEFSSLSRNISPF